MRYRINEPFVAFEVFDDETVLLNLEQGAYYSLNESGGEIWRLIVAGESDEILPGAIGAHFGISPPIDEVKQFVQGLINHQLIVGSESSVVPDSPLTLLARQWHPPAIAAYTDMRELLAMDPPLPTLAQQPA